MDIRPTRIVALWSILAVLFASSSWAQRIGTVHRMVEGKRGKKVYMSERGEIWNDRVPRYPVLGDTVVYQELLRLYPGLRLDLRIDQPDLESRHVFSTDTGTLAAPASVQQDIIFDQVGIYEISEDPRRLRRVELLLTKGMMWLELKRGGIAVRTAGTSMHVDGTEVLFAVDQDSTRGIMYLHHGTVSFPDYPDINVEDGQAWRLQSDLRPTLLTLLPAEAKQWRKTAKYNRTSVWRKVWWKRRVFYIPAGAVVLGAVGCALFCPDGDRDFINIVVDF